MDNQQLSNNRKKQENARKYFIEIGQTYGLYKVTGITERIVTVKKTNTTYNETLYECLNTVTNKKSYKRASQIIYAQKKFAQKSETNHQLGLRKHLYRAKIQGAKNRNIFFDLDFDTFDKIISEDCVYCGAKPAEISDKYLLARADMHQEKIAVNGIDRVDPTKGYIKENCVPCCQTCNYMKRILQKDEFLNHIIKIYNFSIIKSSTTIENTLISGSQQSTQQANGCGNGKPLTGNAEGEDIVSTSNI